MEHISVSQAFLSAGRVVTTESSLFKTASSWHLSCNKLCDLQILEPSRLRKPAKTIYDVTCVVFSLYKSVRTGRLRYMWRAIAGRIKHHLSRGLYR